MSPRHQSFEMGLPPFRGAVRNLVIATTAIYVLLLMLRGFQPGLGELIKANGMLQPQTVRAGWLWQLVTYGFVHDDPLNFVFAMLGVYFLGAAVEDRIGSIQFYGLYFGSLFLAGTAGIALSFTGTAQGIAFGAGAAANAILMVFYLQNRGAPIMMFPLPIQIPVSYIVIFTAAIETAYLFYYRFVLFFWVLLFGLGAGYVWYMLFLRRGVSINLSERLYGLRNAYYRWKRRRAAKKFQVYMRKHDRNVYFDEYGNYKPPDDKRDDERGGWVN
jgi:membrane associated rhomboid family serine protease